MMSTAGALVPLTRFAVGSSPAISAATCVSVAAVTLTLAHATRVALARVGFCECTRKNTNMM